jgi:HlyD family secretion protein
MFKKILLILFFSLFISSVVWIVYYFINKSVSSPTTNYQTKSPKVSNIEVKIIATGEIIPIKEIESKPEVSGIIEKIFVKEGEFVTKGQKLAKIHVIPDPLILYQTITETEEAKIALDYSKVELNRMKTLFEKQVIPDKEYKNYLVDFNLKSEKHKGLLAKLELLKNGSSKSSSEKSNIVYASADGMIINITVKEGEMVIESNAFNGGTTIASVANMKKLMFEGNVDESEVGKIKIGMNMSVSIGAIENKFYQGKVTYIAEKGDKIDGTVKFLIRGQLDVPENEKLRVGYSATAEIILENKKNILALDESLIEFEADKPYVELETSPNNFNKLFIKTGISDGIMIEVLSPLSKTARIKVKEHKL